MTSQAPRRRLARRLLAANALVIAAGAVTLAVVALLVSPALFQRHVERALGPISGAVGRHLDQALSTALLLSLSIAVAMAAVAALAVSWTLSSRLARPIEDLSRTAGRLAGGDLSARANRPSVNDELADLTASINHMAASLEHTEDTRRRLLSDLAHELRTPLSTIQGYLEGLADGVVAPDRDTWDTLQDASDRLRRLIDDVALVSRAEEGQLDLDCRLIRLDAVIADATSAIADAFRRGDITVVTDVADDLPIVQADSDRLHQVLGNLLDNARRHTPPGGQVTLTVRHHNGRVTLKIADTGGGIDARDLPHIFERFYRADAARPRGSGSGIGLTIARAIARAHGGELTASSPGRGDGTTFVLDLPAADRRPATRPRSGASAPSPLREI